MRSIAISNQKGGVAKTTTAVNLAVGLARHGRRTILVDMDPQGNASFALLGQDEPGLTVYDLLVGKYEVEDVRYPTAEAHLDVIPSDINLAGAEVELISSIGGQTRLKAKLEQLPERYDYLIIDTPPSLGLLTINALAAVNEVIIPVSTSFFALKGIMQLEQTIEQVRTNLNCHGLHVSGVLCTIYDRTNVANDVVEAVRERYGERVFTTIIAKNVKLEEAHSRAQSVYVYEPKSAGARDYLHFVEEVIAGE